MYIELKIIKSDKDKTEDRINLPKSFNSYSSYSIYLMILNLIINFNNKGE